MDIDNVMSIQGYHTMHSKVLLCHGISNARFPVAGD